MTENVYNLRLRMTRLASILWGVWLVAVARQVRPDGVEGGGGPIRTLVSFIIHRNLSANMRRARLLGYSLKVACSG